MTGERLVIDLTGTNYDALETDLTQRLGLKVFLVRGWTGADAFENASAKLQMARTQEAWEEARAEYFKRKATMIGSLRANIAERDPFIGAEMSDDALFSLKEVGHVTLRADNATTEHAVIIFDPFSSLSRSVATLMVISDKKETMTINLVEKTASPDDALDWALALRFENWWARGRETDINVRDLVENFDMEMEDIRRYKALMNVRYALRNQHEFTNKNRYGDDSPSFYNFADLDSHWIGMHKSYYDRNYRDVAQDLAIEERYGEEGFGIKDKNFFEKLKLTGAIMNLVHGITPNNTFARMKHRDMVDDAQIKVIMTDLFDRMKNKIKEINPDLWYTPTEWRIRFPLFREVYEADKSTGAQREFLDTIMAGLQRFFPTITNAPLPSPERDQEPPRKIQKAAQQTLKPPAPGR